MNTRNDTCWIITFILLLFVSTPLSANVSIVRNNPNIVRDKLDQNNETSIENANAVYTGSIKVHIIEPVSRWKDNDGYSYDNAHLSYALLANLNIPDATVWDTTITWDGTAHGFPTVTSDNIGTAVAIFTSNPEICDAYPPNGYLYYAYYADASALALPGIPGMNQTAPGFTHSVYVEEGTATW